MAVLLCSCASRETPSPVIVTASQIGVEAGRIETPAPLVAPVNGVKTSVTNQNSLQRAGSQNGIPGCLSERQKLGQLIAVLLEPAELSKAARYAREGELGFIGLLGHPGSNVGDTLRELQRQAPYPVLIASDEESKAVQRLDKAIYPLPSTRELTQLSTDAVREIYRDYGQKMKELGVSISFAPILDVGRGPGINSRSFGTEKSIVIDYARAVSEGLQQAGVMPVLKHFPGHGSASADSHFSLPTTKPLVNMQADLSPYEELASPNTGIMVAHLKVPGLSGQTPTSLSPNTISGLLREQLGFNGIVFTDALNMGAITNNYTTIEASIRAINAGADVVMISGIDDISPLLQGLSAAVKRGRLSMQRIEHSTEKVLQLKNVNAAICGT